MAAIGPATTLSPLICALDFSDGEPLAQPLCVLNREAYVNCSDKQAFPPDTVKVLGEVKVGQDDVLWLSSQAKRRIRSWHAQFTANPGFPPDCLLESVVVDSL